jgi:hypothetical protein
MNVPLRFSFFFFERLQSGAAVRSENTATIQFCSYLFDEPVTVNDLRNLKRDLAISLRFFCEQRP